MLELPNDLIKVVFLEGWKGLWEPYSFWSLFSAEGKPARPKRGRKGSVGKEERKGKKISFEVEVEWQEELLALGFIFSALGI